jgi:hypothetical protein
VSRYCIAGKRVGARLNQAIMNLTRKEFLLRSSAAFLPSSVLGADVSSRGRRPNLDTSLPAFNVRDFGAKGDGQTKDTEAIQAAIDAAGHNGGTVCFHAGSYLSGTIRLRSQVVLFLESGATLLASPDPNDFDPPEKLNYLSYSDEETTDFHYALVRGQDLVHVGIAGLGEIDGNRTKRHGPKPIAFKNCQHVAVRDITIRNSPNYNISLLGCDYVTIDGVTILNSYCDGIDPDCCQYVRIANCFVESWDDAIVPKASFALGKRRSTENLVVTNCVLSTGCNCFKLGTESSGDFKNITVSNCTMLARPELWKRAPISGVAIETVDSARVERVAVSNITMAGVQSPLFIRLGTRGRAQETPPPGALEGISIPDIIATGATRASSVTGIPGFPARRITLRNIRITANGGGAAELAHKLVPELAASYPDAHMFGDLPAYGLFCRHVDTLVLDAVHLHLDRPDARPAMIHDDVENLELHGLAAAPPSGDQPVMLLHNVRRCFVHGLRAQPGTKTFCKLSGAHSSKIVALGNDLTEATNGFQIEPEVDRRALREEANLRSEARDP